MCMASSILWTLQGATSGWLAASDLWLGSSRVLCTRERPVTPAAEMRVPYVQARAQSNKAQGPWSSVWVC